MSAKALPTWLFVVCIYTRWFKYDRDKLWLVYTQIVPVIFEPPCIYTYIYIQGVLQFHWLFSQKKSVSSRWPRDSALLDCHYISVTVISASLSYSLLPVFFLFDIENVAATCHCVCGAVRVGTGQRIAIVTSNHGVYTKHVSATSKNINRTDSQRKIQSHR